MTRKVLSSLFGISQSGLGQNRYKTFLAHNIDGQKSSVLPFRDFLERIGHQPVQDFSGGLYLKGNEIQRVSIYYPAEYSKRIKSHERKTMKEKPFINVNGKPNHDTQTKRPLPLRQRQEVQAASNILLPDHKTLDEYLTRFFGFFANRPYEGAALFELIPAWVRFLQAKGLVTEEDGQQALKSMQALSGSMVRVLEGYDSDPMLAENMRRWG